MMMEKEKYMKKKIMMIKMIKDNMMRKKRWIKTMKTIHKWKKKVKMNKRLNRDNGLGLLL